MTDPVITIESLSEELISAYEASGMERGKSGRPALEWTFGKSAPAFAVARAEGRVVGMSAYIGADMEYAGRKGRGLQAVDSFVDPSMRGRGLFTSLARAYADRASASGVDVIWGFPNDNAAPAWFDKLGWQNHRQVPFLIKPLRAGYVLRKFGLPFDFPLGVGRDQRLEPVDAFGYWADEMWARFSNGIGCGTIRDATYLTHRLVTAPQSSEYRIVAETDPAHPAIVVTREAKKHGGHIAYVMEAMGGKNLCGLLVSELARLRGGGVEIALAWAYPWSPSYAALRRCGFIPLPERIRPIRIWFGGRALTNAGRPAMSRDNWHISYLDSDTV